MWGKEWGFLEIGLPLTFWAFMANLRTVLVPTGMSLSMHMYYSELIMRLKVYWNLNLPPSWAYLVLNGIFPILYFFFFFFVGGGGREGDGGQATWLVGS